jgi:hypothetical protein
MKGSAVALELSSLLALSAAAVALAAMSLTAQVAVQPSPKAQAGNWTPPKTPWGDPDLQGNYTNKYEYGTPFERPKEFEGRRLEDVTSQELGDVMKKRQEDALERAKFLGGDPEGKIGNSAEFRDIYEVSKGSRACSFGNGPFDGPEDFSLYERCITRGFPGSMLPGVYGNSYQIVQGPGSVGIRYEMIHETRVIPLDGRPHASQGLRLDMGDARGHWEGATLVVETTNFTQRSAYRNANAGTLRLVERFTRTAPRSLNWSMTVDDPSTWTRPWTFAIPLTMNDDERIMQYECHEGNQAVRNILSAARAGERSTN